jgi:hypothetical protein
MCLTKLHSRTFTHEQSHEFARCVTVSRHEGQGVEDENENAALAAAFSIFDTNHDGFLEGADLKRVFETLGWNLTDGDVKALFDSVKPSKSGKVWNRGCSPLLQQLKCGANVEGVFLQHDVCTGVNCVETKLCV